MPVTVREQLGGGLLPAPVPPGWAPEPCPDLAPSAVPWHDWLTPWRTDITTATVDEVRTAALSRPDLDTPIDLGVPNGVYQGATRGMPLQIPGTDARAQLVLDRGRPPVIRTETRRFLFWTWQVPVSIEHPIEAVTMPPVVRREGDPQGAWDQHAYLWRPDAGRMVEMIQLDHTPMFGAEWTVGWDGGGPGIAVWDTTKAWDAAGQPRGVVAAHIPQMPHFIRFDEVAAGRVNHAAFFALPRYGPGRTGYARASDGKDSTVPLRAGERLRLTDAALRRVVAARGESSMEATVATGLRTHGAVLGDTGSTPSFIATQDPRWKQFGWRGLGLRLSDFEVVTA